jgi:hypothetical protein
LATAKGVFGDSLTAFVAYDDHLLATAIDQGLAVVQPGR